MSVEMVMPSGTSHDGRGTIRRCSIGALALDASMAASPTDGRVGSVGRVGPLTSIEVNGSAAYTGWAEKNVPNFGAQYV